MLFQCLKTFLLSDSLLQISRGGQALFSALSHCQTVQFCALALFRDPLLHGYCAICSFANFTTPFFFHFALNQWVRWRCKKYDKSILESSKLEGFVLKCLPLPFWLLDTSVIVWKSISFYAHLCCTLLKKQNTEILLGNLQW